MPPTTSSGAKPGRRHPHVNRERSWHEQTTRYRLARQHAAAFIARGEVELPWFTKDELDAFLERSILVYNLRPPCGAQRMSPTAAHLGNYVRRLG